ncbi:hypothetical protein SO802_022356 [Lithocarpus litseifolius]|uniref:PPM-type phosphatase domain-containing protein n=1 Tax=Lithocarpus litseifolius TaxID=425828 RepID=A0AAW2CHK5_9ROSI
MMKVAFLKVLSGISPLDLFKINKTVNCQFATFHGHREYQEDRIVCDLDMKIPHLGKNGHGEGTVGVMAVFDGHIDEEASEMASKLLLDYFYMHVLFNTSELMEQYGGVPVTEDEITHLEILKEALLGTIRDIDFKFYQASRICSLLEAFEKRIFSGSTATMALLVDGKILIANVGDSKALLCTKKIQSGQGTASGIVVTLWGKPWVNAELPMSLAIGDVYQKRFGVIAELEVTGWQTLDPNDRFLVVSSDGIFESITPQDFLMQGKVGGYALVFEKYQEKAESFM